MNPVLDTAGRPAAPVVRAADLRVWHEAAAVLADAEQQRAEMRESGLAAFEAERRRGHEEGAERGAAEMAQRMLVMGAAAEAALDGIEQALPGLVCDVVESLLGQFDLHDLLRPAVRHALGRLRLGTAATIRVAPEDMVAVRAACAEADVPAGLRIEADPSLSRGRCLVESDLGTVELGLEAQLAVLRANLAAAWEQAA